MTQLHIDTDFIVRSLQDLVRINSINPSLAPDGPGEAEIADYVGNCLSELGLQVHRHEIQPGRYNVVGILPGKDGGWNRQGGSGQRLMLNAHLDTVGVDGMAAPFSGEIRAGKLFGRGAFDMKGSLAACLGAMKALVDSRAALSGDVLLTAVADEEYMSIGTQTLVERYRADAAIVTEPTGLQPCVAHKGYAWLDVSVLGRAAHGSRFNEGVDANLMMGRFLGELEQLGQELISRPGHALVGPPSLHVAKMWGGSEWSMYAARSQVQIERRAIPGENLAGVQAEVQAVLDRLALQDPNFKAHLEAFLWREPFEVQPESAVVSALRQTAAQVLPQPPALVGEAFWMDSAILAAAGIETVIFGPAGGGAHAAEEWVELQSVFQTAQILAETAQTFCA